MAHPLQLLKCCVKFPHLFCGEGLHVGYQRLAEVPGAAEGAFVARQPAAGRVKKLAGISFVPVALVAGDRHIKAEGIYKIVQIERAVPVDAADARTMRADNGSLLLDEGIDRVDQIAHMLRRQPGSGTFRRIGTEKAGQCLNCRVPLFGVPPGNIPRNAAEFLHFTMV